MSALFTEAGKTATPSRHARDRQTFLLSEIWLGYPRAVTQQSLSAIVWRNLQAIFENHVDAGGTDTREHTKNAARLAAKAGVGLATLDRLKNAQDKDFRSPLLLKIAKALDMHPWQLLYPGFDPRSPPQVLPYSEMATIIAREFDRIEDPADKAQVNAVILQMVKFGTRRAESPAADPAPAPAPPAKTKLKRRG